MDLFITIVIIYFADLITTYNIINSGDASYLTFPKWEQKLPHEDSKLEFKFKTKLGDGLLLKAYGKNKNENELSLSLVNGKLELQFKMGSEDMLAAKELKMGSQWNDMRWHKVKLTHRFREIVIAIDNYEYNSFTEGESNKLSLTSNVFFGGEPNSSVDGYVFKDYLCCKKFRKFRNI